MTVKLTAMSSLDTYRSKNGIYRAMQVIEGTSDNDQLFGSVDTDLLLGREGNDNLAGGDGNDLIYGEYGDDSWQLIDDGNYVFVSETDYSGAGFVMEQDDDGGNHDDYLTGGAGNDILIGGGRI